MTTNDIVTGKDQALKVWLNKEGKAATAQVPRPGQENPVLRRWFGFDPITKEDWFAWGVAELVPVWQMSEGRWFQVTWLLDQSKAEALANEQSLSEWQRVAALGALWLRSECMKFVRRRQFDKRITDPQLRSTLQRCTDQPNIFGMTDDLARWMCTAQEALKQAEVAWAWCAVAAMEAQPLKPAAANLRKAAKKPCTTNLGELLRAKLADDAMA